MRTYILPKTTHASLPNAALEAGVADTDAYTNVTSQHLVGFASRCQRRAAYLLNSVSEACAVGHVAKAAYHAQQARRAGVVTGSEALVLAGVTSTSLYFFVDATSHGMLPFFSGPLLAVSAPMLGVHIGNTFRHVLSYSNGRAALAKAICREEGFMPEAMEEAARVLEIKAVKDDVEAFARALEHHRIDTHDLRERRGWYSVKDPNPFIKFVCYADCSAE